MREEITSAKVLSIFGFALLCAVFSADFVVMFGQYAGVEALTHFRLFAIFLESPIFKGESTPEFVNGLKTAGGVAVLVVVVAFVAILTRRVHHGTARWAPFMTMRRKGFIKNHGQIRGAVFGKTAGPRVPGGYLTSGEHAHSLVVAPTRAGKGVGVVVPTLLTFRGSVLALDVKGELFELTSRARRSQGHKIYKFSPFDPLGRTHSYNPMLDIVRAAPSRRFAEARRLAFNLITAKGKGAEGFLEGARDLFVAGVLACIERETPTIGAVYDLFSQPGEKYKLFSQLAEESEIVEVKRIFNNMAANDTKILTSYTSVLGDGGLNLWADPLIRTATMKSDFSIYDLRRRPATIYLCVSPNDLEVIAPLVRLFFQQVVSILQRTMPTAQEKCEVLFLLDEFKHLGKLDTISTAITTIAGYNGRFMFIVQSLSALSGAYGKDGRENFLSNTGIQVFMATADEETPDYISKAIGDYTYKSRSRSIRHGKMAETTTSLAEQGARLIRPEQIRLLDDRSEIVLIKGLPPLMMRKVRYYEDAVLSRLFRGQTGPLPEPKVTQG